MTLPAREAINQQKTKQVIYCTTPILKINRNKRNFTFNQTENKITVKAIIHISAKKMPAVNYSFCFMLISVLTDLFYQTIFVNVSVLTMSLTETSPKIVMLA